MALFKDLMASISQSEYFTLLMARHAANEVPTQTWLSVVNIGLSVTQYVSELLAQQSALLTETFRSLYLEEWQGLLDDAVNSSDKQRLEERFRVNAKNFYGIEYEAEQLQVARFVLTSVATAPTQSLSAGSLAGTTGNGLLWAAQIDAELVPSQRAVVEFVADTAGSAANVPIGTELELKSTFVGVSITNQASGAATAVGTGNAGLYLYAAQSGVTVAVVNLGASLPLLVTGNLGTKIVTVQLRTNGAAVAQSTADEVRKAINAAGGNVAALVIYARNQGTGGSVMASVSSVALDWDGSYIQSSGSDVESAQRLRRRCETRLDTIGGGGGLGLPPGMLGTEDSLVFWGLARPTGYKASPVRWVRVLSNNKLGVMSGGESTVILASQAGAVTAADVTAVSGNYESPRKYWGGINIASATLLSIPLIGVIHVRSSSGKTLAEVKDSVAAALVAFLDVIGDEWSRNESPSIFSAKMVSVIDGADPNAILWVEWTGFVAPIVLAWNEFPSFNTAGLAYQYG